MGLGAYHPQFHNENRCCAPVECVVCSIKSVDFDGYRLRHTVVPIPANSLRYIGRLFRHSPSIRLVPARVTVGGDGGDVIERDSGVSVLCSGSYSTTVVEVGRSARQMASHSRARAGVWAAGNASCMCGL